MQLSIAEPELVNVVMVIPSTGWFVGGELKLLMEKDMVCVAARVEVTALDILTNALESVPVHCTPELTF